MDITNSTHGKVFFTLYYPEILWDYAVQYLLQ